MATLQKKRLLLLIFSCVFVVSTVLAVLFVSFLPQKEQTDATPQKTLPEIDKTLGEAIVNGYPSAYPTMTETQINRITISNKASDEDKETRKSYTLLRTELSNGKFVLYYPDENGDVQPYYPDIIEADSSFDFESLYSTEQNDGYNGQIYKITYLCAALGLPYFDERIPIDENEEEKEFQFRQFGLDDPSATILFEYTEGEGENKKTVTRKLVIGDKNPTGIGYYFMVDDRPYVYCSSNVNYFDYALLGFYSYVNSVLVSKGLAEDSSYEPYLTTDYKQWKNETHTEPGTPVGADSVVVIYTDIFSPFESDRKTEITDDNRDGYIKSGNDLLEVNLSYYKNNPSYRRLVNALTGGVIGVYYDPDKNIGTENDRIIVTLTSDSKAVDLGVVDVAEYEYEIIEIEAVLTDSGDIVKEGYAVGDNNLVRIAYYLTIDGERVSDIPYHGVIDLSRSELDSAAVSSLRALSIGKLSDSERVKLAVSYTKENSIAVNIQCKIVEIISVYDKNGVETDKITETSQVTYRYTFVVNGEEQGVYYTAAINLETEETENGTKIKDELIKIGAPAKHLNIVAYEYTQYCEYVQDFLTYKISRIDYFVTQKLISAFRFQNNSERDPYYGESIYQNTMDNSYGMYGLNSSACEEVIKILGGVGDTTGRSDGLIGSETVAVGLTPEVKEKYGLYANTVYFELPRGIIVIDSGDEETIDDYTWYETLGFTLYISDEDPVTKTRYVGSDLYDIVAKVSSDKLVFLEESFVNFWARRNLILMDVEYIRSIDVKFTMDDFVGGYNFELDHKTAYISGNQLYFSEPENYSDTFNFISVAAKPECICGLTDGSCRCVVTKLSQMAKEEGKTRIALERLYKKYITEDVDDIRLDSTGMPFIGLDYAGTSYFKEVLEMLYLTQYEGAFGEDEDQAQLLENSPMLMQMSVKLRGGADAPNASDNYYVYEFYRCDDRRVMVRLYQIDKIDGTGTMQTEPVTDFYISILGFKKIVSSFTSLLNAELFDTELPYVS